MNRNWEKVSKYVNKKKVGKYELIRKSLHNVYDILSIIDSLTDRYYMALSFVYVWLRCWLFLSLTVLKNQEDAYCMETNSLQDVSTAGREPVFVFFRYKIW